LIRQKLSASNVIRTTKQNSTLRGQSDINYMFNNDDDDDFINFEMSCPSPPPTMLLEESNYTSSGNFHLYATLEEINLDDTLIYEQQNDNLPHHNHHRYDETDDAVGMGIKGGTELQ